MDILKTILMVIYIIVSVVLIILTLVQTKDGESSATISGSIASNHMNQGNDKETKMKKVTILLGVCFAVLAIVLGILYM